MSHRLRIVIVLALVVVLGCSVVLFIRSREPRYEGRTLSEWLQGAAPHPGFSSAAGRAKWHSSWLAASNAIYQIGPPAVPFLLKWVKGSSSGFRNTVGGWLREHSSFHLKVKSADECYFLALIGFDSLGNEARSAQPNLIEWTHSTNTELRFTAFSCLVLSKPERDTLLPVLLRLIHDPEKDIHGLAARILHNCFPKDAEAAGIYKSFPELRDQPTNQPDTGIPFADTFLKDNEPPPSYNCPRPHRRPGRSGLRLLQ